nr:MAG TPA_asm: hypothetical protein [Caudoviricetes sp.]
MLRWQSRINQFLHSNAKVQLAGNRVRGGKRPAPGMARAERARDGGFCVFPI